MKKSEARSTGLYLAGIVANRTRRMVPIDNPTTEIVTYTIMDDNQRRYYVDDYAPERYYEINEFVEIPVYSKPYRKRNGELSCSLSVRKPYQSASKGESF